MSATLTKQQRQEAIAWLLDTRFNFSQLAALKRDFPQNWNAVNNGIPRGAHSEALNEKTRLDRLSDEDLIAQCAAEINFRENNDNLLKETTARLDAEEREDASHRERTKKIVAGGKKGHQKAHGTPEQKAARYRRYQEEVDKVTNLHPRWSNAEILRRAAAKLKAATLKVSESTLRRHTRVSR